MIIQCNFCRKYASSHPGLKFVGQNNAALCEDCIRTCNAIIAEKERTKPKLETIRELSK